MTESKLPACKLCGSNAEHISTPVGWYDKARCQNYRCAMSKGVVLWTEAEWRKLHEPNPTLIGSMILNAYSKCDTMLFGRVDDFGPGRYELYAKLCDEDDSSERFFADDRGNVVDFYDGDDQVARLDREAGDTADQTTWDGRGEIERWACQNGYADEINQAVRLTTNHQVSNERKA